MNTIVPPASIADVRPTNPGPTAAPMTAVPVLRTKPRLRHDDTTSTMNFPIDGYMDGSERNPPMLYEKAVTSPSSICVGLRISGTRPLSSGQNTRYVAILSLSAWRRVREALPAIAARILPRSAVLRPLSPEEFKPTRRYTRGTGAADNDARENYEWIYPSRRCTGIMLNHHPRILAAYRRP